MERIKLLIAEGAEDFRIALMESLQGAYQVRTCAEGNEALALLREFQPDLVILDLMLPGLDGITILERAVESGIRPMVLATTRFDSPYILDRAGNLGVGYMMRKPCDLRATIDRLSDLAHRLREPVKAVCDPKKWVGTTLLMLGFSPKLKGFSYLQSCITLMDQNSRQAVTKELYPAVAAMEGVSSGNVERACRSAIEKAWLRGDIHLWRTYFPEQCALLSRRPTNTEFILRLARATPRPDGENGIFGNS